MTISIIVPTYNEEDTIIDCLQHLANCIADHPNAELLVVDGGSRDQTVDRVRQAGVRCLVSEKKGRAPQMNLGAEHTAGDILYFVHADSTPPNSCIADIYRAFEEGYDAGCYRFKFDSSHPLLKINAFMTRFDRIMCRGGDQTLFVRRSLFDQLDGYKDDYIIMEDYELIERIQAAASFKIIQKDVTVSSRKYHSNGYLKVQIANFVVFMMYFLDCPQEKMVNTYRQMIALTRF